VRSLKLRAGDELLCTIVVKPLLARLETRDYRVTRSDAVFRRMLIWRTIAAADVSAFGASAKMQPPSAQSQAFDATCSAWLDCRVDTIPLGLHRLLSDLLLLALSADAQYAIRVKKCGLGARHSGRSLLSSGMRRPRRSLGSIREPWYPDITMQCGKFCVFEHSQAITSGLAKLAQAGIKETAAPKIESSVEPRSHSLRVELVALSCGTCTKFDLEARSSKETRYVGAPR
jgi:hypothetical protein